MKEEVRQILKMVEDGKLTAEQAAQLMEAGSLSNEKSPAVAGKARWLKIRVYDIATNRKKVNVSIPLSLVSTGLKLGIKFGLDRDELKGFDFDDIINQIQSGAEGNLVDVEDEDTGEKIEVYIE